MQNPSKPGFLRILSILVFVVLTATCDNISKDAIAQNNNGLKSTGKIAQVNDLVEAVKSNDFDRVKELIRSGEDSNGRDDEGYTILQIAMLNAIQSGNNEMLELLLKSGANPNLEILIGTHPLEKALLSENDRFALLLLQYGADVNIKFGDRSVLTDSIIKERKELSVYLITHGARVNEANKIGRTPMFYVNGNWDGVVKLLLGKGADVNHKDRDGLTPLFIAVKNNDIQLVRTLVENGANVNAKDKDNWTPLQQAMVSGCSEVVEFLKQRNAKLE